MPSFIQSCKMTKTQIKRQQKYQQMLEEVLVKLYIGETQELGKLPPQELSKRDQELLR
jgi:hypothetical protein